LKLDRTDVKAMNIRFSVLGWKADAELRKRYKDPATVPSPS
jgi:hypothetical protein